MRTGTHGYELVVLNTALPFEETSPGHLKMSSALRSTPASRRYTIKRDEVECSGVTRTRDARGGDQK